MATKTIGRLPEMPQASVKLCIIIISITIVQSYIRKYHECVAMVMLLVQSTSNNAKGDKRVICFRDRFVAMVILILSYKYEISSHIPLPMNVAK